MQSLQQGDVYVDVCSKEKAAMQNGALYYS